MFISPWCMKRFRQVNYISKNLDKNQAERVADQRGKNDAAEPPSSPAAVAK